MTKSVESNHSLVILSQLDKLEKLEEAGENDSVTEYEREGGSCTPGIVSCLPLKKQEEADSSEEATATHSIIGTTTFRRKHEMSGKEKLCWFLGALSILGAGGGAFMALKIHEGGL